MAKLSMKLKQQAEPKVFHPPLQPVQDLRPSPRVSA